MALVVGPSTLVISGCLFSPIGVLLHKLPSEMFKLEPEAQPSYLGRQPPWSVCVSPSWVNCGPLLCGVCGMSVSLANQRP
jgi:hypothetical protein